MKLSTCTNHSGYVCRILNDFISLKLILPGSKVLCSGPRRDPGQAATRGAAGARGAGPRPHQPRAEAHGAGHHRRPHRRDPSEIHQERGETLGLSRTIIHQPAIDTSVLDN